jgi:hypothetical protein
MFKRILTTACIALVSLAIAGGTARAQKLDPSTRLPAVTVPAPTVPPNKPTGVGSCAVLWDLTHGIYISYEPAGVYSQLVTLLAGQGISVTTTAAGLDNIDLSPYNVIVINEGSSWNSPYTPSEVAAIQSFQARGGGLLIMGDNNGTMNVNINPVSIPLGTTCGLSLISPFDLYINNFIAHVIFSGISSIYMRAAGALGVLPPSVVAAIEPAGAPVVSVVDLPRTVITGDINLWDNNYIGNADDEHFAVNVFHWLCEAGATPTKPSSWGKLKTLYR